MRIRRLDIQKLPSLYREVLQREVEKLKRQDEVVAIGLAGSVARGDFWRGADLDIEVILKGDRPKNVVCTEQEISVDYGYFGEAYIQNLPHDTLPIYDPVQILTKALQARTKRQLWKKMLLRSLASATKYSEKAQSSLRTDLYSALCLAHVAATELGSGLILATGMAPSVRRTISKLEQAMKKIGREDLFREYVSLYGMPSTVHRADFFLSQLREGYREIWPYFRGRTIGPKYMIQQPDSENWFRNRIEPIYENDKRDLVWIVFVEYHFVLEYILRTIGREDFPDNVFTELKDITRPPALWINRYRDILKLIPETDVPNLVTKVQKLLNELQTIASTRYLR
jgi:predicted nucleotidyltransferase